MPRSSFFSWLPYLSAGAAVGAVTGAWLLVAGELVHSLGHEDGHQLSALGRVLGDLSPAPIVLPLLVAGLVIQLMWQERRASPTRFIHVSRRAVGGVLAGLAATLLALLALDLRAAPTVEHYSQAGLYLPLTVLCVVGLAAGALPLLLASRPSGPAPELICHIASLATMSSVYFGFAATGLALWGESLPALHPTGLRFATVAAALVAAPLALVLLHLPAPATRAALLVIACMSWSIAGYATVGTLLATHHLCYTLGDDGFQRLGVGLVVLVLAAVSLHSWRRSRMRGAGTPPANSDGSH